MLATFNSSMSHYSQDSDAEEKWKSIVILVMFVVGVPWIIHYSEHEKRINDLKQEPWDNSQPRFEDAVQKAEDNARRAGNPVPSTTAYLMSKIVVFDRTLGSEGTGNPRQLWRNQFNMWDFKEEHLAQLPSEVRTLVIIDEHPPLPSGWIRMRGSSQMPLVYKPQSVKLIDIKTETVLAEMAPRRGVPKDTSGGPDFGADRTAIMEWLRQLPIHTDAPRD